MTRRRARGSDSSTGAAANSDPAALVDQRTQPTTWLTVNIRALLSEPDNPHGVRPREGEPTVAEWDRRGKNIQLSPPEPSTGIALLQVLEETGDAGHEVIQLTRYFFVGEHLFEVVDATVPVADVAQFDDDVFVESWQAQRDIIGTEPTDDQWHDFQAYIVSAFGVGPYA